MSAGATARPALRVEIVGGGSLARAIAARLASSGMTVTLGDSAPSPEVELVVWAREGVTLGDAFAAGDACLRAGTASIFVIVEGDEVAVGPLTVPGRTACLACAIDAPAARAVGTAPAALGERVADDLLLTLVHAATPDARPPALLHRRLHRSPRGWVRAREVWPRSGCEHCALALVRPGRFDLAAGLTLGAAPVCAGGRSAGAAGALRRVGVVGGGTAGYLTALALRRLRPSLEVTLLESSSIPVIGVGEATTPDFVDFLHRTLDVDERELYREVQPTWKLGIRFLWGEPGGYAFHHPFTGEHLLEACAHAHDQDLQSLSAQLMARDLAPVLREPGGRVVPLLAATSYAYHLDNRRFVTFLKRLAERRGVAHVDCTIDEVALGPDGRVDHLQARDGRTFSFDLYVDATGFRSQLLEQALRVPFHSYGTSLFADAAVFADVPNAAALPPYTLAETMDGGWCWGIPQLDTNHRGYVFSSSFLSPDAAEAEMRAKNPGMRDARLVRFRSGRLAECWRENVVAVGNAYGFVEPLESTALHMLIYQIRLLVDSLPDDGALDTVRARLNDAVGAHWDYLRGFLALHFRFNRKLDTPFWRACRADVDLAGGEALLAAYREGAPLTARPDRALLEDTLMRGGFFGLLGVDNVLLGQKVPTRLLEPRGDLGAFDRWVREGLPIVLARALPLREALAEYTRGLY